MTPQARSAFVTVLFLLTTACGGSADDSAKSDGALSGGGAGSGGSPSAGDPGPNDCTLDGARLVLTGTFDVVSIDAEAALDTGRAKAAIGTDAQGRFIYLGRAGDAGDADFIAIGTGTFDVAEYPHNLQFMHASVDRTVFDEGFASGKLASSSFCLASSQQNTQSSWSSS